LLKFIVGALALWAATKVVPGVSIGDNTTLLVAALLLGIVNAIVRPILIILTFPLTLVTLGLFLFVINGITVSLVDWFLPAMKIDSFGHAMLAALVIWVVSWGGEMILGVRTRQSENEG
jgi:putative membrane protein